MALDYHELWKPYSIHGHRLENTIGFLVRQCEERNIPTDIVNQVIEEVFTEIANGKEYPRYKCPCGCGIDKAGTAITHDMLRRIISKHKEMVAKGIELVGPKEVQKQEVEHRFNSIIEDGHKRHSRLLDEMRYSFAQLREESQNQTWMEAMKAREEIFFLHQRIETLFAFHFPVKIPWYKRLIESLAKAECTPL